MNLCPLTEKMHGMDGHGQDTETELREIAQLNWELENWEFQTFFFLIGHKDMDTSAV